MLEQFLQALLQWSKQKPVKVTIVSTPIYESGFVNRPANCSEISFTNTGAVTCFLNKRVLFPGGIFAAGMLQGETDITAYDIQFDTAAPGAKELSVVFKITNQ
jgi:hypothetical protein